MKGIETTYKGRLFRSRLEARWAAFFDLLHWHWEYEPFDCDGWIPDFQITGAKQSVLVEVKPIDRFCRITANKIDKANDEHEVLLVGSTLLRDDYSYYIGWLGVLDEFFHDLHCRNWALAPFGLWDAGKGQVGFCHSEETFSDRISGGYDGGCHGALSSTEKGKQKLESINIAWNMAANEVQWKKTRPRPGRPFSKRM